MIGRLGVAAALLGIAVALVVASGLACLSAIVMRTCRRFADAPRRTYIAGACSRSCPGRRARCGPLSGFARSFCRCALCRSRRLGRSVRCALLALIHPVQLRCINVDCFYYISTGWKMHGSNRERRGGGRFAIRLPFGIYASDSEKRKLSCAAGGAVIGSCDYCCEGIMEHADERRQFFCAN